MRLLTFNLWHGLSPSSLVAFEALEPTARRLMREELQEQLLADVDADFSFFQECNPIAAREKRLAARLDRVAVSQPDLVGLKLLGLGFPYNLNSGLLMLAKSEWGLRKVEAVSLSRPGTQYVRSWGSWQLKEERFAVFGESMVPGWGRVLFVNTHLHHGLEITSKFMADLDKLAQELELSDSLLSELKGRLVRGNARRMVEVAVLLEHVDAIKRRYNAVVVAGDMNCSPDSEVHARLRAAGFRDAWEEAVAAGVAATGGVADAGAAGAGAGSAAARAGAGGVADAADGRPGVDGATAGRGAATSADAGISAATGASASAMGAPAADPGATFDGTRNHANHLLQSRFPLTLVLEDLSFSTKVKEALLTLARTQENRPRRIDYLWLWSDQLQVKVKHAELVGLPNAEGLAPSDHFGVVADIDLVK
jgi:endonuclease/exonuclease/phosphatase family metal-dependent hydrolase